MGVEEWGSGTAAQLSSCPGGTSVLEEQAWGNISLLPSCPAVLSRGANFKDVRCLLVCCALRWLLSPLEQMAGLGPLPSACRERPVNVMVVARTGTGCGKRSPSRL